MEKRKKNSQKVHIHYLTVLYIAVLSAIALLAILGQVLAQCIVTQQASDSRVVNIAGRQRMLSQQLSKTALAIQADTDPSECHEHLEKLRATVTLWERSQQGLQNGDTELALPGTNSAEVTRMFAAIEPPYQTMLSASKSLLVAAAQRGIDPSEGSDSALLIKKILAEEEAFLRGMDDIVFQYDREAKARVTRLNQIEFMVLSIILMALLSSGLFIFRPTDRKIRQSIAELERTQEELLKARDAAAAANRAKSDFLANMSHELRTPLNAIIGFSEILIDEKLGSLLEKQKRSVGNVLTAGRHLLALINDILDLAKVEAGKMELELGDVEVGSLLRESMVLIQEKAMKHELRLSTEIEECVADLRTQADARKLKQILFNLLSNAAKFTPDGGEITVGARYEEDVLVVFVRDTGIGIAPDDLERAFGKFEQVDSSYARTQQGTGLGLALTRRFVELHGGRIWAESEGEGKGSTFTFTLPIRHDDAGIEEGTS